MILVPGARRSGRIDIEVYTRQGTLIPEPEFQDRRPPRDEALVKIHADELVKQLKNKCTIRSTSAYPYNCVGMIFASRRVWVEMNRENIELILREDGYRQIRRNEVMEGDVVLYKKGNEPSHVALVLRVDRLDPTSNTVFIKALSKWGLEAEFIHFIDDVPIHLGKPVEYWTERPS